MDGAIYVYSTALHKSVSMPKLLHAECSFSVVCQAHGLKAQNPQAKAQGAHGTWAVCLLPIAHELCYGAHQMCPFILPITQPTNSAH